MVLVMSVEPGYGGQKYIESVNEKITYIREKMGSDFDIEVDGGINANNIDNAINAGANIIVAGTAVFNDDIDEVCKESYEIMRAVIIGNGDIKDYQYIKSKSIDNDFIICADGGYNHAEKMGIVPDVLIGDFDSANEILKKLRDRIEYPKRKDFTDGELAVAYAVDNGYEDIVLSQ